MRTRPQGWVLWAGPTPSGPRARDRQGSTSCSPQGSSHPRLPHHHNQSISQGILPVSGPGWTQGWAQGQSE